MDSNSLNTAFEELYIPESPRREQPSVPPVAPSLVMQDKTTDTTHHLRCGCCPNACIHQKAWWNYEEPFVRPSLATARSSSSIQTAEY